MKLSETTANSSMGCDMQYMTTESLIGLFIILLLGLPGNVLIVIVILKVKGKKSTTTQLLLNLAIADIVNLLLVDVCVVLVFSSTVTRKKTVMALTHVPKIAANYTLALISLERYSALVKTMKLVRITKTKLIIAIVVSWVIAVLLLLPHLIHLVRSPRAKWWPRERHDEVLYHLFWAALIIIGYTIPLLVIVFCYASILKGIYLDRSVLGMETTNAAQIQEKRRLVHILFAITLLFIVCNVPTIAILTSFEHGVESVTRPLYITLVLLSCMSSCVNPYVYALKSEHYRSQVKNFLSRKARANDARVPRAPQADTRL